MKTKLTNVVFAVVIAVSGAFAQQRDTVTITGTTSNVATLAPTRGGATLTQRITKDGHYTFNFDDPDNEWRCFLTSRGDTYRLHINSINVVCVKVNDDELPDDRPAGRELLKKGKGE